MTDPKQDFSVDREDLERFMGAALAVAGADQASAEAVTRALVTALTNGYR
ncbi:hypothetical protein HSBAA_57310 [Vreelandella sulfidaeris]|uniref:Uncharacterized protein n=1 Tax=Vreelandella sulfidaeris TaxID=115553 RepID=A0A455UE98_9GAMM|nr:hypothetical protein HSBAA_57310 [Halomonas sulfidaeris]